jgi:hypothetical protein
MKPSRLVALYPAHWRERYGKEFSALLEELPVSPSVVLDVLVAAIGARLSYVRRRFTGEIRPNGTGTVARLARVAMLTVLIVTPFATGAVGYYLGRSQVSPVAEPAPFPIRGSIRTFGAGAQNSPVDFPTLQRLFKNRTGETGPGR